MAAKELFKLVISKVRGPHKGQQYERFFKTAAEKEAALSRYQRIRAQKTISEGRPTVGKRASGDVGPVASSVGGKSAAQIESQLEKGGNFGDYVDWLAARKGINSEKAWDMVDKKGITGQDAIDFIKRRLQSNAGTRILKSQRGYQE